MERLLQGKRLREFNNDSSHICYIDICFPETEAMMIKRGALKGSPINKDHIYICNSGTLHICSPEKCNIFDNESGVCPISGRCYGQIYSSYDKNDYRTYKSKPLMRPLYNKEENPVVKKRKYKKSIPDKDIQSKADNIITKLLFSSERTNYNKRVKQKYVKKSIEEKKLYLEKCYLEHQYPLLPILIQIDTFYLNRKPPLVEFEYNEITKKHYSDIILQTWNRVKPFILKKNININLESIILGIIYMMRNGCVVNEIEILPNDPFLLHHLPIINNLGCMGFDKKKVTKGENLLRKAFEKGMADGEDMSIEIHKLSAQLVIKNGEFVEEEEFFFMSHSRKK